MNLQSYRDKDAGKRLQDERELAGLTPGELASLCGVSESTIYNIEKGRHRMTYTTCRKICKVLGDNNG